MKNACQEAGKKLLKLTQKMNDSPLAGLDFKNVQFVDGHVRANEDISKSVAIQDILQASGEGKIAADGKAGPNPANMLKYSMHSYSIYLG